MSPAQEIPGSFKDGETAPGRSSPMSRAAWSIGLTVLLTAATLLFVGIGGSVAWIGAGRPSPVNAAMPGWVSLPPFRVTTADGAAVTCRVALAVGNAETNKAAQQHTQQLTHVVSLFLATMASRDLSRPDVLSVLPGLLKNHINQWLVLHGIGVIDGVAIEDILLRPI